MTFTADDARNTNNMHELDERIENAVRFNRYGDGAYIRIYHDDSFARSIEFELEKRGFKNISAQSFTIKTDVYFEWD